MYYYTWGKPPLPGPGSYATHPAHEVFHVILTVVTSVNLLLQVYTFYLVLRVARTQLNEYRYFMMLSTTWDTCLTLTLGFAIQPHVHGPLYACISARGPVAAFGHEGARISVVLLYTFGVNLVGSQVYSMVYRVTAVHTNPSVKRRFLSWPFVALFLLSMLATSAGLSYAIHIATVRDTDELYDGRDISAEMSRNAAGDTIYVHRDLWRAFLHWMKVTEYITEEDTSMMCFNSFDWTTRYVQAGIVLLFVLIEVVSSSAAFWIIRRVGRLSSQSQAARRMHVQLTRLLLLQMLCPLICMLGPVLYFVMSVMWFRASIVGPYVGLVIIGVFPMVNALLTITFVGPYRRFTVGWLKAAAKGDLRAISSEQTSSGASSSLAQEVARTVNSFFRINANVQVPGIRLNTLFGIRRHHIYPLPMPPTNA
ncbi:hypothetical protein AAVH_14378 [Aphelenchoides avenae]|nr:hypothetical protein AAVH_14378 [Aphelenchus avenae]